MIKNLPGIADVIGFTVQVDKSGGNYKVRPEAPRLDMGMDFPAGFKVRKKRASIDSGGKREFVGLNSNVGHSTKEPKRLFGFAHMDISGHKSGPRYDVGLGHFVEQTACIGSSLDSEVGIEEMIGCEGVVEDPGFEDGGMGFSGGFEILGVLELVDDLGVGLEI